MNSLEERKRESANSLRVPSYRLMNSREGTIVLCRKLFTLSKDNELDSVQLINREVGMCFCKTNQFKKLASYVIPLIAGTFVLSFVGLVIRILIISD